MRISWLFRVVVCVLVIAVFFVTPQLSAQSPSNSYQLIRPAFVQASPNSAIDLGTMLDQEAGIAAYYKSADVITLSQVKPLFKTIEVETSDYILGSVGVTGYVDNFDTHVYVHHDGWIMAYYLKADPISKIIDIKNSRVNTTILKNVVSSIAGTAGLIFTDVTYYDFRYPNATNLMLVGENRDNGSEFTIQMPTEYGYNSIGWAARVWYNNFKVDGVFMTPISTADECWYGLIPISNFGPGVTHTMSSTWDTVYSAIIILYRVP